MIGFLKKNIAAILFIVLSLIFGGCIGYSLIIFFGKEQGFVSLIMNLLLSFLIMIVCIFLQIIIHETGHLTVALMRGWKFISFMAFGFILTKRDGTLQTLYHETCRCRRAMPSAPPRKRGLGFWDYALQSWRRNIQSDVFRH